ncbi:MAG: S1C family serine protease [Candidatus Nanopelagicales bacterium]
MSQESRSAPARRAPGLLAMVAVAAAVAAVVGSFAGLTGYLVGRSVDEATGATPPAVAVPVDSPAVEPPRAEGSIADIAAGTLPSVVSIIAEGSTQSGSGSGFVVRSNGYILTNNHVVNLVADGGPLMVVFSDGARADAEVVGTNASYDLAVIKVDRTGLPAVTLGDSEAVQVGDAAIAIGAPLGLDGTVTSGIISAVDRPVTTGDTLDDVSYMNAIQTDAAINPGNSGGPLLNSAGSVIGVNSAIATLAIGGEAGSIGLGFAIPINSAKRVAEELIATGQSRTPVMGVRLAMDFTEGGAKVEGVNEGSPAQEAGLREGDVILRVNGRAIDDGVELVVEVRNHAPGDEVTIDYTRGGQERSTTLVLAGDSTG